MNTRANERAARGATSRQPSQRAPRSALAARERRLYALQAREGFPSRPGSPRLRKARAALARALWSADGERRLPGGLELDRALGGLPTDELAWMCEFSPLGPLYFLPTRRFVHALARELRKLAARRVVEVAAGDGFLSRALQRAAPDLEVIATDDASWEQPSARMSSAEQRALRREPVPGLRIGENVQCMSGQRAVRKHAPDVVLCAWLPPGDLLDRLIRGPTQYVFEIGAGAGVTAGAYSWRFEHDFLEGAVERYARCRLDTRPERALHSRVTLYYGRAHPNFHEEPVRPGDWLWQFRTAR